MSARIVVDGDLTVFAVHALKDQLLAALDDKDGVELDLGAVSEIDGAGVQLLVAAHHEAARRGIAFSLTQPSAIAHEALALSALESWFSSGTPKAPADAAVNKESAS